MNVILPQLEHDLREAAESVLGQHPANERKRISMRRLRIFIASLSGLLATTTIALAASGVILNGSPVKPNPFLRANAGTGLPRKGGSKLLPLRIADPGGGLPWGMRVVTTTRGETCVQIGRVQGDKLGELGIDGAFHDDDAFHPVPSGALPEYADAEATYRANELTSCTLAGEAVAGEHDGVDRSAARSPRPVSREPHQDLRNLYYGLLGPEAVSVTYKDGAKLRTQRVVPKLGAYLIVLPVAKDGKVGYGSGSLGTYGDLQPSGLVTKVTYRIDGKLCERGHSLPPGAKSHLAHPCPFTHWHSNTKQPEDLGRPIHVELQIRKHVVVGAKVSFTAPYAVSSAGAEYRVAVPSCGASTLGVASSEALDGLHRDVRRGATVTLSLSYPFGNDCGHKVVTIEGIYQTAKEARRTIVGKVSVKQPKGTRNLGPGMHESKSCAVVRVVHIHRHRVRFRSCALVRVPAKLSGEHRSRR